jgi:hypothetical protein
MKDGVMFINSPGRLPWANSYTATEWEAAGLGSDEVGLDGLFNEVLERDRDQGRMDIAAWNE